LDNQKTKESAQISAESAWRDVAASFNAISRWQSEIAKHQAEQATELQDWQRVLQESGQQVSCSGSRLERWRLLCRQPKCPNADIKGISPTFMCGV
jgi:hypothetical protein